MIIIKKSTIHRLRFRHMTLLCSLTIFMALLLVKVIWVYWSCHNNCTPQSEKNEVIERCAFLKYKIVVPSKQLLQEMPSGIGLQFQGEWALYSCSMLNKALGNISRIYPDTKQGNLEVMDSLIDIVKSPELRLYDKLRWDEDPLEHLDGDMSHLSYISHLAWMITEYRNIGGQGHKELLDSLCETMNRRILESPALNLTTYPDEPIYVPDMLVAIIALHNYGSKYQFTINKWLARAKSDWLDKETGLLVSFLNTDGTKLPNAPIKGSYSALNCYYLTHIDTVFAKSQYKLLKTHFCQNGLFSGLKEYNTKTCWLGMDIDAGPIIFNLSPSGTAFVIGSATYFGDNDYRKNLLRTAEIAGHTVSSDNKRHYLLADVALVGEAITLAMRTNYRCENNL